MFLRVLSKNPSKTAKFHLQIVENRLEFQSKILPGVGIIPVVGVQAHDPRLLLDPFPVLVELGQQPPVLGRLLRVRAGIVPICARPNL